MRLAAASKLFKEHCARTTAARTSKHHDWLISSPLKRRDSLHFRLCEMACCHAGTCKDGPKLISIQGFSGRNSRVGSSAGAKSPGPACSHKMML